MVKTQQRAVHHLGTMATAKDFLRGAHPSGPEADLAKFRLGPMQDLSGAAPVCRHFAGRRKQRVLLRFAYRRETIACS